MGDNENLSLQDLSHKLAMLLALTRPTRSVNLANLDLKFRSWTQDGVTFKPAVLAKQSNQRKERADFYFPAYFTEGRICPVTTLKQYERSQGT